jgi:DNA helicase II / ATP-dependent DNA helicase PcrA
MFASLQPGVMGAYDHALAGEVETPSDGQGAPSDGRLRNEAVPRWAEGLNSAQLAAVSHPGGPLLIVAGAGTGKTRTLAARVARLLDSGVRPDRILLLTFTRRAANEMLTRVGSLTDRRAAARVWGGTFHAVANRLLRLHGPAVGLSPAFSVLDQHDAADVLGMVRTELGLAERGRRFPRSDTLAAAYSRMVNTQQPLAAVLSEAFPWCAEHHDDLGDVFAAYTARKRKHNLLDFDDLLLHWRALAASPASGPAIAGLFDHVLVDEYQDTNALQADIVARLCGPDGDVTVVGDDAQAIYGFRAATVENMAAFTTTFRGAAVVSLEQNYRSAQPILDVANAVLAQQDPHPPAGPASRGEVGRIPARRLWTERPGGRPPRLTTCPDGHEEATVVCETVLELREEGVDLAQQAVLFRAGHHSDLLELELARRDIPFVKYGGLRFLEAAHVKDVMAMLRVVDNPADAPAWHRVLALLEGVGPAALRRLHGELGLDQHPEGALDRFVHDEPRLPSPARPAAAELRAAWADCAALDLGPGDAIDRLRGFCGLVFPGRYSDAASRLADMEQLALSAAPGMTRSRFLTELALDPPERAGDLAGPAHLDDDHLVLSTIHSAKGCEWRVVHLIGAADGNLPSDMALADRGGLAEERRLVYVALTRARDLLHVTFPLRYHVHRRGGDDRHHLAQLSRFLQPVQPLFDQAPARAGLGPPDHTRSPSRLGATVPVSVEVDAFLHGLWRR